MSIFRWLLSALLLVSLPASAEVMVLIHGYHSSGATWRTNAVIGGLHAQGWQDAGDYFATPAGIIRQGPALNNVTHVVVTVDLPSEAPIIPQARLLQAYLTNIQKDFPEQPLILIGHSAGGVVARYLMVNTPNDAVSALLTLASPHLGTASAELGSLAGNTPLGAAAPFLGLDTINRSEHLFDDLMRERYGSLLHWLNRQPHPDIQWISLVRSGSYTGSGRFIVPGYSQDLRNVVALQGRAISYTVPGDHELNVIDGGLIADIVKKKVLTHKQ